MSQDIYFCVCGLHGIRVVLREFLFLIIHLQCSCCIYRVSTFFFICDTPYKSGFILGSKIQGGPNCLSAGIGGLVGPSKYSGSMIISSLLLLKKLTLLDPPRHFQPFKQTFLAFPPHHCARIPTANQRQLHQDCMFIPQTCRMSKSNIHSSAQ